MKFVVPRMLSGRQGVHRTVSKRIRSKWPKCFRILLSRFLTVLVVVFSCGAVRAHAAQQLYICYSNGDNYVEEYNSNGPGGVNTDLGPLPGCTTDTVIPNGIAMDFQGNIYVANDNWNTITKFSSTGTYLGVFASGLNQPAGIALDRAGHLYIVNNGNSSITKVTPAGVSSVFVSSGLGNPQGIAVGPDGNIYVSNQSDNSVKKITPAGVMTNFYQDGSWTVVNQLEGLAFDASGNLYVASNRTSTVEEITPSGSASVMCPGARRIP